MQIQNVYIIPILNILVSSIPNPIQIPVSTNQHLRPPETWIWTPPVPRGPCSISTLSLKIEAYASQKKKKHAPPHVVACTPGTKWPVVSSDKFLGRSVSSSLSLSLIHPAGLNLVKPNWKVDLKFLLWRPFGKSLSVFPSGSQPGSDIAVTQLPRLLPRHAGLGTVGFWRMEMAKPLPHPLLPAACLLLPKVHRKTSCYAERTLGALLVTAAAAHQFITPFCLLLLIPPRSITLSETWPASSFVLLPRQMSRRYLGGRREPMRCCSSEPSRNGKCREGSWETLLSETWGKSKCFQRDPWH